jgi:predicted DNA-binding protein YlxM (UPF0122 family)
MSTDVIPVDNQPVEPVKKKVNRVNKGEALELYFCKNKTMQEIADHFGVDISAVSRAIRGFLTVLDNPESIQAYRKSKANILTSVEMKLVSALVNSDKLKDASLNNVAYALQQVSNILNQEGKSGDQAGDSAAISAIHRELFDKQGRKVAIEKEVKVTGDPNKLKDDKTLQKILKA